ncbi:PREDICTED: B3 domain-containing protein Os01g0234100-like [Ipomoea nil]|uniref:B3 domain-containing protein Os01g0234100-like n=1 Tax=Ipomoea nil TaxID=35883 RepID=UPI00090115D0|nr:PREDICTED: B3 domain-containing protein Os01g0234100-like [Ipomoea nil]
MGHAMRTGQSSMEPLMHEKVMRKEQCQQNPEEEEDEEDQLTLSFLFMNKDRKRPSASPSLVNLLGRVTHPRRKRSKRTIKKRFKKSAAFSSLEKASHVRQGLPVNHVLEGEGSSSESGLNWMFSGFDMKNFNIRVNGGVLDSEISYSNRVKYYNLCHARKSCLHNRLIGSINLQLAAGIILGTVSIADEIRASCLSTFQTKLELWDKRLQGFKYLGMEVGFLQERIKELKNQFQKSNIATSYSEIMNKENRLKEEITSLETRVLELKEAKLALQIEREHLLNRG